MRKLLSIVLLCLGLGIHTYVQAQCNGNAPIINTFSPNTGFIGSTVTITGANFDPTPASNQVFFGATKATVLTASFGVLTVQVPVGASTAPIAVKNGCNLIAYSPVSFNGIFCPTPITSTTYNNTAFELSGVNGAYNMLAQDMDLDGKPDVVSAYNGVTVARNTSTPGTLSFTAFNFGNAGNYNSFISTADFDGDGRRDLFGTHNIYQNTSSGPGNINFNIYSFQSLTGAPNGYQNGVGDFNNDGKIDVVMEDAAGTMYFYRNTSTGPGNIGFAFAGSVYVTYRCTGIQCVDADGDGKTDVLATQGDGNRAIALRNLTTAGATSFTFGGLQAFNSGGAYPYRCQVADFDKDGRIDLATVNYNSPANTVNTAIFRNISTVGNINFAIPNTYSGPVNNYRIGVGDVNGDGLPDIVTKSLAVQAFAVYPNTSSGSGNISFAPRFDYSSAATAEVSGIVIGDLDGDFVPDIATSGVNSNTIRFHRNTSAQTDNTPPTALCKSITVALSPSGTVTVTPQMIDNGSGDACGIGSLQINNAASVTFTCANIGNNTVTLKVTDKAGNVSTCTATVNVAPAAIIVSGQTTVCQGQTVTMNANLGDSYQWYNNGVLIPGATSQTYIATVSGNYTVTVTNAGGCSGTSSATAVTVNNNPTVSTTPTGNASLCPPGGTVVLSATLSSIYQWKLNGNNIGGATQQTYTANGAGSYSVQVIDLFGCTATSAPIVVTNTDNIAPTAIAQNVSVPITSNGTATVTPSMINNGSTDNCGGISTTICSEVGTGVTYMNASELWQPFASDFFDSKYQVLYTASELAAAGLTAGSPISSISFNIAQKNTNSAIPGFEVKAGFTAATSIGDVNNTFSTASLTTVRAASPYTTVLGWNAISFSTPVIWDGTSSLLIQTCHSGGNNGSTNTDGVYTYNTSGGTRVVSGYIQTCNSLTGLYTHNVVPQLRICSDKLTFTCADRGNNTVTLQVTDANNNSASANATVTVTDPNSYCNVAPVAVCKALSVFANGNCEGNSTAVSFNGGSTDADGDVLTYAVSPAGPYKIGVTNVTLTVTDTHGANSSCNTTITVVDNTPPVISCPGNISVNNNPNVCGAVVTYSMPTATDNCSGIGGVNNTATAAIVLQQPGSSGGTLGGVAYNPLEDVYYAVDAGSGSYAIKTYPGTGGTAQFSTASNFDYRGAWWNSNTNKLEGNRFNGGYRIVDLDVNGNAQGSGTDFSGTQPESQSLGTYDPAANQVLYYFNGSIHRYNRSGFGFISSTPVTGLPVPATNINSNFIGYSGINGAEVILYDRVNRRAYFVNKATGAYSGQFSQLPASAPAPGSFDVSFTNGILFLYGSGNYNGYYVTSGVNVTQTAGLSSGSTFPVGTTTNTFVATDASGNTATCSFTVTVADVQPPSISCPGNISVIATSAAGAAVTYTTPVGTDNCPGATTARIAGLASGSTFPLGTTTVTYKVTDAAGLSSQCSFTVTVVGVPPSIHCPANIIVNNGAGQCGANVTFAATETAGIPASTITYDHQPGSFFAVGTTTVTATATNAVGSSSCTFTVTVNDVTPPVIACPFDIVVNADPGVCGAKVSYNQPSATDNCGGGTLPTSITGYTYKGTFGGHTYFLSNNQVEPETAHAAAIGLGGHLATISSAAENAFVSAMHPDRMWIGFTDRDNEGTYRWVTNEPITYTNWAAGEPNNCCGGPGEDWAVINWTGPTWNDWFYTQPAYYVVEFEGGNIPTTLISGPASGSVFPVGTTIVTWSATDGGGNSVSCSFTVTVNDAERPQLVGVPGNTIVECDAVPAPAHVTATDNCPGVGNVNFTEQRINGNCISNYQLRRTWSVTDAHGNSTSAVQIITVRDTQAPSVTTPASDMTVECDGGGNPAALNAWLASNGGAAASDACGTVSWFNNFSGLSDGCGKTGSATVTFTVKDQCGNTSSTSATFTIIDTQAPSVTSASDMTVECDGGGNTAALNAWLASHGGATASDVCSGVSWSNDFTALSDGCGNTGSATVIFTATDECGNASSTTATFTIADITAPVITCPADATVNCQDDTSPAALGSATGSDVCSGVTITSSDASTQNADLNNAGHYNYTITRTWTATDECGNSTNCVQTITVHDVTAPMITCPANTTVNCQDDNTSASNGKATATDNCAPVTITESDASTQDANVNAAGHYNYTITRTWRATDVSGNYSECVQTITVHDVTAPVITCPANTTVNCQDDNTSASNGKATATDNCAPVTITESDASTQNADVNNAGHYNYTITRTWRATDVSGNYSECTQTITVHDVTAPSVSCPADVTVNCQDNNTSSATGVATGSDICSPVAITESQASTRNSNPNNAGYYNYKITRTWKATDVSGNYSTCTQTIKVQDVTAPAAKCQNVTITLVNGSASITTAMIDNGSTDNCSPLAFSLSKSGFNCSNLGANTVTLTVKDVSGNTSTCTATVTVVGEIPTCSIASVPTDATYTGGVSTNLYLGYGAQSTKLQLSVPASGAPYTFQWSGNGTLSSTTVQSPLFAPTAAGNYTFTVFITNKYGCTTTCTISICVMDIRILSSNGTWDGKKVYICHVPPGNPGNANTLEVSVNAVPAHIGPLGHATDRLGKCTQTPCASPLAKTAVTGEQPVTKAVNVLAYPNPNTGVFRLQLENFAKGDVQVQIVDNYGKLVADKMFTVSHSTETVTMDVTRHASGVYFARVVSNDGVKTVRIVVAR
jgi:hypothetical protein